VTSSSIEPVSNCDRVGNDMSNQIATITSVIRTIRGKKVILDADLARIYGVSTKALNQAVKRNLKRFPDDFLLRLSPDELENLRSQFVTSSLHGGQRYLPYAFTENGAIMAANVLNSPEAVRMSVFVVRAFVKMRELLGGTKELAKQLAELEKKLTARLDGHEVAIVDVLRRVMEILDPPPPPPEPPRREIGFHIGMEEQKSKTRRKKKT
jgi:ORF6N domain